MHALGRGDTGLEYRQHKEDDWKIRSVSVDSKPGVLSTDRSSSMSSAREPGKTPFSTTMDLSKSGEANAAAHTYLLGRIPQATRAPSRNGKLLTSLSNKDQEPGGQCDEALHT